MAGRRHCRLLARRVDGIFLSDLRGEIGPDLFRHACLMGLEGFIEAQRPPYRAGRSPHWVKVKNRRHHAFNRVMDQFGGTSAPEALIVLVMPTLPHLTLRAQPQPPARSNVLRASRTALAFEGRSPDR
jgi:hypothetical protein